MLPNKVSNKDFEQQKKEFLKIIQKIKGEKDTEKIEKAVEMINNNPDVWEVGSGVAGTALDNFLHKIYPEKRSVLLCQAEMLSLKNSLDFSQSGQIEKLIINQILFSWIGLKYAEHRAFMIITTPQHNIYQGEYWHNILTRYQKSYLRAIESLARVRKLGKGFAFQVNIATDGGQQVNVNEMAENKKYGT